MQVQIIFKVDCGQGVDIKTYDSRSEGSVDAAIAKARARLDADFPCVKQEEAEAAKLPDDMKEPQNFTEAQARASEDQKAGTEQPALREPYDSIDPPSVRGEPLPKADAKSTNVHAADVQQQVKSEAKTEKKTVAKKRSPGIKAKKR